MSLKTAQKIAIGAGALLFISPWLADRGKIPRLLLTAVGAGLLVTAPGNGTSKEDEDLAAYFSAGLTKVRKDVKKEALQVVADYAPAPIRSAVESVMNDLGDGEALFREFLKKSFIIVAETNGGKTWLEHQALKVDVEAGRKPYVIDKSYGKRTTSEAMKTGFGLWHFAPVDEVVFRFDQDSPQHLPDMLYTFYQERQRRKHIVEQAAMNRRPAPDFQQHRLTIAELNNTIATYVRCQAKNSSLPGPDDIDFWISEILFDGHGYGLLFGGDAQTAAVGKTSIDESQRSQINWLLVGSAAINPSELKKFGLPTNEWKSKVLALRKVPGYERAGIMLLSGQPKLWNPVNFDIEIDWKRSTKSSEAEKIQDWLNQLSDQVESWIQTQPATPSASTVFDQFKEEFPAGRKNRAQDNPYWEAFKHRVNQIIEVSAL